MNKDEALKLALEALVFNQANWQGKDKAINAIKEALAQPETLPWTNKMSIDVPNQPLYTAPYTWVGLTDEERNNIWDTIGNSDAHGDVDGWSGRDVMKAIEAKLKEKNT